MDRRFRRSGGARVEMAPSSNGQTGPLRKISETIARIVSYIWADNGMTFPVQIKKCFCVDPKREKLVGSKNDRNNM